MKHPASSRFWPRTPVAAALAAMVPLLILWPGALLRGVFFQADLVVYYYPAYCYAARVLRTGLLPLWAPELEGGQPFHAQWEPTLLYPIDAPFRLLLPPWWALNVTILLHYALAAVAMFAYMRRLSLSRSGALVSAAIYAVNGFMIAHLEHPNLIVGAAWLPLLLLATESGLAGRRVAGALGMGGALAMMLLGGHPDLFLMGTLVVALMALFHPAHGVVRAVRWREALAPIGTTAGGYALGLGLAAAQLLPTLGLARLAWQKRAASVGYQDTWSLRPFQFLAQLLPDLYGRNGQDTYWGAAHYWEECSYVGGLALALAIIGLFSRHRMARFYAVVAALAVWLAMGTNGLAFALLRQLPGFGTTRLPCRYMFLFDLSVAVLAGCGTHWLSRIRRPAERARAVWLRGLMTVVLGLVTLWLLGWWLHRERLLGEVTGRIVAAHRFHAPDFGLLMRQYVRQLGLDVALLLGGLALAVSLLVVATRATRRGMIPLVAWVGVVVTLFLFGSGYHTLIPARLLKEEPFTVRGIHDTAPAGPFRVLQWDSIKLHSEVAVHRGWWPRDEHGYRQYIAALPGNYNLVWGLASVRQEEWSALPLPHTRRLASAILANGERGGFGAVAPYMPWWNAGYVISRRALMDPSLQLVTADRIRLYRTPDPGQRAWIVHEAMVEADEVRLAQRIASDPRGLTERVAFLRSDLALALAPALDLPSSVRARAGARARARRAGEAARVVDRTPTRVELEAVVEREGYLVLGESWAPGWRAWIDGRPAPILRANLVHRAVAIAPGRHLVAFRYEPADFRLGLYLSCTAVAALLAVAAGRGGVR